MTDLRVAIAGGGTGGHVSPALAVAESVAGAHSSARVMLFGSACGIEARHECGEDFETVLLDTPRSGGGVLRLPVTGARMFAAVGRAVATLKRFRPHVVVGTGGYASVAPGFAARSLGIPLILLEQNVIPGRANRLLARIACEVHTQFRESLPYFPYRACVKVTGNPVRGTFHAAASRRRHRRTDDPFTLLVMGGSQGAHSINVALAQALPLLGAEMDDVRILHCAGERDEEEARERLSTSGLDGQVWGFYDRMWELYAQADLAVCRAGATSMAEREICGLPSILIPYPYARDRHQDANAAAAVEAGASEAIDDSALNGRTLADRILSLVRDPVRLARMGAATRLRGAPRAGEHIVASIERLAGIAADVVRPDFVATGTFGTPLRRRAA